MTLKWSTHVLPVPTTIFLMTSSRCRCPFLQNDQLFNLHFQKTPAAKKMSTLAPQVPATIFLMTSSLCGISFLQNDQLFNLHFQKTQAAKKMSTLAPQVPATSFLMTSSHCRSPFLQNVQLFNTHRALSHLICQKRRLCLPLAFLQNGKLQTNSPLTPMPSTFTGRTPKSTPETMPSLMKLAENYTPSKPGMPASWSRSSTSTAQALSGIPRSRLC